MNKITISHTVLYGKGWYERTDNLLSDIQKCLTADGYSGEYFNLSECAEIILRQLERLPVSNQLSLSTLVRGIQPGECWKYGYYTKDHKWAVRKDDHEILPDYDVNSAIIWFALSYFVHIDTEYWSPVRPDYTIGLNKPGHIKMERIITMFPE